MAINCFLISWFELLSSRLTFMTFRLLSWVTFGNVFLSSSVIQPCSFIVILFATEVLRSVTSTTCFLRSVWFRITWLVRVLFSSVIVWVRSTWVLVLFVVAQWIMMTQLITTYFLGEPDPLKSLYFRRPIWYTPFGVCFPPTSRVYLFPHTFALSSL